MRIRRIVAGIAATVLLSMVSFVNADPILVFSSPDDLSHVTVGQTLTIDVSLDDLAAGQQLSYLGADVDVNVPVLAGPLGDATTPYLVASGGIVPDADGYTGTSSSGLAQGSFDVLFSSSFQNIADSGKFFSFTVQAAQAGTGILHFKDIQASDDAFNPITIAAGGDLTFSISDASVTAVPLPSTAMGGALLLSSLSLLRIRRDARKS